MNVQISPVKPEDQSVLKNLLQLYLYDFTEFDQADVNETGLYEYPYLDLYWVEPSRHPFLMTVDENIAGFALIDEIAEKGKSPYTSVGEFFILRKYRNQGIGRYLARHLFDLFPGLWQVHQIHQNIPAQTFWRKVIHEYTDGNYQEFHRQADIYQKFRSRNAV